MKKFRVLLITPPMVQFNTPYAATPLLTAFLRDHGVDAVQADLSLDLALRLFSPDGLRRIARLLRRRPGRRSESARFFLAHAAQYRDTVNTVMRFCQGRAPRAAAAIASGALLPRGPRFRVVEDLRRAGRDPAAEDRSLYARFLAGLYVDDLGDVLHRDVEPRFGLSRYAESLTESAPSFAPIARALDAAPSFVDRLIDDSADRLLRRARPDLVGLTIPFPGNLYAACRIARRARAWKGSVRTVAGGGFINTELAELGDPRIFDYFDFLTFDDGEVPLLRLVEHLQGRRTRTELVRTRHREGGRVVLADDSGAPVLRHRDRPAPCYDGLPLKRYCNVVETLNPMSRLWTERRWMKLQLAHGCYWHRCAFCDASLDYIARYDPADAETIVRWVERVVGETGETGFHFVDEAAPPALLGRVAERLIARGLRIQWWSNIRFERAFTPELAGLLARSGCVAVTGGMECAERRLLARMHKGVTLEQIADAAGALAGAGILVHAYLMYGFPRQTVQETVDALEFVRRLFRSGRLQSAYWHRFVLTVHSPIFARPWEYGVHPLGLARGRFARNAAPFRDGRATDHAALGRCLQRATYNFMYGVGLEEDVRAWFDRPVRRPRLPDGLACGPVPVRGVTSR